MSCVAEEILLRTISLVKSLRVYFADIAKVGVSFVGLWVNFVCLFSPSFSVDFRPYTMRYSNIGEWREGRREAD